MKRKLGIVTAVVTSMCLFIVIGCKNPVEEACVNNSNDGSLSTTPYATEAELSELTVDGYVDYRVARFFALNDLDEFSDVNEWSGASLSAQPLIIYHTTTETPRYYEFRVIKDGDEVGSIACVAEESEGDPVQYVMSFAKDVTTTSARSVSNNTVKLTDCGYPSRLIAKDTSSSRSVDATTNEEVDTDEYAVDVKVKEFLENADSDMLAEMGITTDEIYDNYIAEQEAEEERVTTLWAEINEAKDNILAVTDDQILVADANRSVSSSTDYYNLDDWYSKREWHNPKAGVAQVV